MRNALRLPIAAATATAIAVLVLAGCGHPRPVVVTAGVDDFLVLRTYGWETTVADPQAQWNPETYQVLARSVGGFVLLEEGRGKQQYFIAKDQRETVHPVWVSRLQFAFGPAHNTVHTTDGRLVPNSEGLTVVSLRETLSGRDYAMSSQNLTNSGSHPRVWGSNIVAQFEDRIVEVDPFGQIHEFGPGFYPEPQRNGLGICWQELPVFDADYWTGNDHKRGRLFIRWKPKILSELANAVEARWTPDGGVLATVMRGDPPPGQPWWQGGTDVWYQSGPGVAPVLVAADARSPAPHPNQPVFAAVGKNGSLITCGYDGNSRRLLADHGDHPQWSWDGLRLVAEEPLEGKTAICYLKVYVFKVGAPLSSAVAERSAH